MDATDIAPREISPTQSPDDLTADAYRRIIGGIGFLLPILVYVFAGWRPSGERPWTPLGSISAYYYTGAVSIFAGGLAVLAVYLLGYRGYANPYNRRDRIAARIASAAAIVVALFPTGAPSDSMKLSWWTPLTGTVHLIAAMVLFICFIFLSMFQFPLSYANNGAEKTPGKVRRNFFYRAFGIGMIVCIIWAAYALFVRKSIFAQEALALEFFAASWLLKGRIDKQMAAAGKATLDFAQDPGKTARKVWKAVHKQKDAGTAGATE